MREKVLKELAVRAVTDLGSWGSSEETPTARSRATATTSPARSRGRWRRRGNGPPGGWQWRAPLPPDPPLRVSAGWVPRGRESSDVDPGSRARDQEGDQEKDDVYEDSQSYADHYPEQAAPRRAAPASSAEDDDEEAYYPQDRQHPRILFTQTRRVSSVSRTPRPSGRSNYRANNNNTAAPGNRSGNDARHPQGTTTQPPRVLPRLQRNIGSPPRKPRARPLPAAPIASVMCASTTG
jgi:hypothetical protein